MVRKEVKRLSELLNLLALGSLSVSLILWVFASMWFIFVLLGSIFLMATVYGWYRIITQKADGLDFGLMSFLAGYILVRTDWFERELEKSWQRLGAKIIERALSNIEDKLRDFMKSTKDTNNIGEHIPIVDLEDFNRFLFNFSYGVFLLGSWDALGRHPQASAWCERLREAFSTMEKVKYFWVVYAHHQQGDVPIPLSAVSQSITEVESLFVCPRYPETAIQRALASLDININFEADEDNFFVKIKEKILRT